MRYALPVTVSALLAVAALLPLMIVFDEARPCIAFGSMAIGAGLLLTRRRRQ